MDVVSQARELVAQGRYGDALSRLASLSPIRRDPQTILLRAVVFEMTGDIAAAKQATTQVLRSRFLGDAERATAELLLARVAAAEGSPEEETKRLERALVLAERVDDPAQSAWIQLRILSLTADRMGPSARKLP